MIKIFCNIILSFCSPGILLITKKQYIGYFLYFAFLLLQFSVLFTGLFTSFAGLIVVLVLWLLIVIVSNILYLSNLHNLNNRKLYFVLMVLGISVNIFASSLAKNGCARSFIIRNNTLSPVVYQNECIIADCRKSVFKNIKKGNVVLYKNNNKIKIRFIESIIQNGNVIESVNVQNINEIDNVNINDIIGIGAYIYYSKNLKRIGMGL